MINRVQTANSKSKYGESWKLINKITGRKAAKRGILKGNSQTDRLLKWQQYFSQLLGKEHKVEGEGFLTKTFNQSLKTLEFGQMHLIWKNTNK